MLLLLKIDFIDFSVEPLKRFRLSVLLFYVMLRIHFILMRIRIQDPHWEKMYPDPILKDFLNFLTKNNFEIFFRLFIPLNLMNHEPNEDIF